MAERTKKVECRAAQLLAMLLLAVAVQPGIAAESSEAKMVSGISIVGNNEAPKSLFIISWKDAEIGSETDLESGLMDEGLRPIDRDVFARELDFYDIRQGK